MARAAIGFLVALGLASCACNTPERQCTKALPVVEQLSQQQVDDALAVVAPGDLDRIKQQAAAEMKQLRDNFVGVCAKSDAQTLACVARIDELKAIEDARRAASAKCPKDADGIPDLDCLKRAREAAKQEAGDCGPKMKQLMDAVFPAK